MSYLPQNSQTKREHKPWTEFDRMNQTSTELLNNIIPHDPNKPYDMLNVIKNVSDRNAFYEIMPNYAKNMITGFSEVEGRVCGVVANQPQVLAGCLDIDASVKAARFIRFCDAF